MECTIREATSEDCNHLMSLFREILEFHHMPEKLYVNPQVLQADGFGTEAFFKCILAELPAEKGSKPVRPIGYALFFFGYSFNYGRTVFLESLYVVPEFRGKGIGVKLLGKVAQVALAAGCVKMKFETMEWNRLAKDFYLRLGAEDITESEKRHCMDLGGEAFKKLAQKDALSPGSAQSRHL